MFIKSENLDLPTRPVNEIMQASSMFSTLNYECTRFTGQMRLSHGHWQKITHANDPWLSTVMQMAEL